MKAILRDILLIVGLTFTLLFMSASKAQAADYSMDLGLWTYHFDREVKPGECTNEKHDLFVYRYKGYGGGTYLNSHCNTSYLVTKRWDTGIKGLTIDTSIVSGYPDGMHVIFDLIILPAISYTRYVENVGITFIYVPTVLVGAGYTLKFEGF